MDQQSHDVMYALLRIFRAAAGIVLLSVIINQPRTAQAQLGLFVHEDKLGLDVDRNPIDKLIDEFGNSCLHLPAPYDDGKHCKFEIEVAVFVDSLPHNRREMMDALGALGVTCANHPEKPTDCVYRKRVRLIRSRFFEAEPFYIIDNTFLVRIKVARDGEADVRLTASYEIIESRPAR
jgi:hypothetical protein